MTRYETVFIMNPDLSEEQHKPLFDKLTGLVADGQGLFVNLDNWGRKKLAYEVKKQTRGHYVLLDFCGDGTLVKEIERNLRLDDRVLKYMSVVKEKPVDPDIVRAEIEAAEEAKAAKEEEAQRAAEATAEKEEAARAAEEQEAQLAAEAVTEEEPEVESEATPAPDAPSESAEPAEVGESESTEEAKAPESETEVSETGEETDAKAD
jgi:small subunit ribosomal protein S6